MYTWFTWVATLPLISMFGRERRRLTRKDTRQRPANQAPPVNQNQTKHHLPRTQTSAACQETHTHTPATCQQTQYFVRAAAHLEGHVVDGQQRSRPAEATCTVLLLQQRRLQDTRNTSDADNPKNTAGFSFVRNYYHVTSYMPCSGDMRIAAQLLATSC
jgi:hypothetical protein